MSHLSLTEQFEVLMQDVKRSVDTEENQNIMDDNTYDDTAFDFLPRERISRYTKLSANSDVNDFDQSESEQRTDNSYDSDDWQIMNSLKFLRTIHVLPWNNFKMQMFHTQPIMIDFYGYSYG